MTTDEAFHMIAGHMNFDPSSTIFALAKMHFTIGWIFTFSVIGFVFLLCAFHYYRAEFKHHMKAVHIVLCTFHFTFALPMLVYYLLFFSGFSKAPFMKILMYFAGFYLVYFFYAGTLYLFWDIGRFALRLFSKKRKREAKFKKYSVRITTAILAIALTASGLSFIVPNIISVNDYNIKIDKKDSDITSLKAVFISDCHIGAAIREDGLKKIVKDAMAQKPDIIMFGGDIFDEGTPDYLKEKTTEQFSKLRAKYGVYYILGNHDDYTGDTDKVLSYFRRAGITVLLNDVVLVENSFYIVGREDKNERRASLSLLKNEITRNLPVFLLDHKPLSGELKNGEADWVDLKLSGHTHDGQIYPAHLLIPPSIAISYGRYSFGNTQLIVSSGVGCYSVPVRLGSPTEILTINIKFE